MPSGRGWDRVGLVSPGGIRTRDPGIDRDEPCPCAPTAATDPIPVFVGVGLVPTNLSSHGGAVILFFVGARLNPSCRDYERSAHLHCTKRSAVQVSPLHPVMQRGASVTSPPMSLRGAAEAIWWYQNRACQSTKPLAMPAPSRVGFSTNGPNAPWRWMGFIHTLNLIS